MFAFGPAAPRTKFFELFLRIEIRNEIMPNCGNDFSCC